MRHPWPLDLPSTVDRAADRREAVDLESCDAIVVKDGRVLAVDGRLIELAAGAQPSAELRVYLGRDAGRDLIALVPSDASFGADSDGIGGETMRPLRDLLAGFWNRGAEGAREHELATAAIAIAQWHASHPRCSRCGEHTAPALGGWLRRCDACGHDHYPRTDPAMIVAITDPEDRLLLAHASHWSPGRFSHLAGFVEPGETFEQAVHREVWEEARLRVTDVEYLGSQPWPFPASIMVAFKARTAATSVHVDGVEIAEARFVSREEISPLVAEGLMVLAPKGSIARRMLEDWFGGPLPEPHADGSVDV